MGKLFGQWYCLAFSEYKMKNWKQIKQIVRDSLTQHIQHTDGYFIYFPLPKRLLQEKREGKK